MGKTTRIVTGQGYRGPQNSETRKRAEQIMDVVSRFDNSVDAPRRIEEKRNIIPLNLLPMVF